MLLIVMFESGTWRVKPGEQFTFGRAKTCTLVLPDSDRGVSRNAGCLDFRGGLWWLANTSASSMLYLAGDLGFKADIPPGMALPLQQWHAKVRIDGILDSYTVRMRLPDLDEEADADDEPSLVVAVPDALERRITSTRLRAPLNDDDRLVLAARFEEYLTWRHSGAAAPRSAREAADRIGWRPHTVAKRCENIRNRYVRIGVPGLRGPRALEELAALLISTGELTGDDLRRLPPRSSADSQLAGPPGAAGRPLAAARPPSAAPAQAGLSAGPLIAAPPAASPGPAASQPEPASAVSPEEAWAVEPPTEEQPPAAPQPSPEGSPPLAAAVSRPGS